MFSSAPNIFPASSVGEIYSEGLTSSVAAAAGVSEAGASFVSAATSEAGSASDEVQRV